MAGDWIKLEKCSPNKPEVMRLARMWGVPQDQAFGAVMRFWIWLDDACVDGCVTGVALHEVDAMMHFPGFATGLCAVGWLEVDEAAPSIRIPNFSRHNGETSKKRALTKNRVSKKRNADVTLDALPEKRREEKRLDTSLRSVSKRATLNAPSDEHEAIAAERGLSCQTEFQKYRDWQASTGKSHKDEVAGFRNWLRNAKVVGGSREPTLAEKRARNMDLITGKVRDERIVEGTAERVGGAVVLSLPGDLREQGGNDVGGCGPERIASGMGRGTW